MMNKTVDMIILIGQICSSKCEECKTAPLNKKGLTVDVKGLRM